MGVRVGEGGGGLIGVPLAINLDSGATPPQPL